MDAHGLQRLRHRHSDMLNTRSHWDTAWRILAEHFSPVRYRDVDKSPSDYKGYNILNHKLYNSAGIAAMRTMAAGLQGGMTSPARPWFQLTTEDQDLAKYAPVKEWLAEVTKRMRVVLHRSNFYNAVHTIYGELGTFGTAFMMQVGDLENGIRFIPFCSGEYCLDTNSRQRVDVVFRKFQMTARQLAQQFGKDNLPQYVKQSLEKTSTHMHTDDRYTVVHAVYPRSDYKGVQGMRTGKHMPWASVYYLDGDSTKLRGATGSSEYLKHVLSESGFEEFPGFGVRWDVAGTDVYGQSPAMACLPDVKVVQQITRDILRATHKMIDPPVSASTSLKAVGIDLTPGGVNYVEAQPGQAPQAVTPIFQVQQDVQKAVFLEDKKERIVGEMLYNDLFKMLINSDRRQITAREIATREEEKLILIGPVLERLHDELFIPLVGRTMDLMWRLDMIDPMGAALPSEINGQIKVEFVSLLAQAQKLVATGAVERHTGFVASLAQINPEAIDTIDVDKVTDAYAEAVGSDPSILRPQEERDRMRAERAQAQQAVQQQAMQQQQMAQTMQGIGGAADAIQKLSNTPMSGDSALNALVGGANGGG